MTTDELKLKDVSSQRDPVEYTTSTGVTVRIKPVSRLLVTQAKVNIKDPKPPVFYLEEKGRSEPNPNDPQYIEDMINTQMKRAITVVDIILTLGVEVVSISPDIHSFESELWPEALGYAGIEVPLESKKRYLAWLKYIAITVEEDLAHIINTAQRQVFTLEADVDEASASFRRDEA